MPKDLFYSEKEGILFLIAGYTPECNVKDMISTLKNNHKHMERISGGVKQIKTRYILSSSRYKSMRMFWCETKEVPSDAFRLGKDWTMEQWVSN